MRSQLPLIHWFKESEKLDEPIEILFLRLKEDSISKLMNLKLYEYNVILRSKNPDKARAELIQKFYTYLGKNKVPGTYSITRGKIYFTRKIEEKDQDLRFQGEVILSKIISNQEKRIFSTLLITGLGIHLRKYLKPYGGRLTKYEIDNQLEERTYIYVADEFMIKLRIRLIPTVSFSPRIYNFKRNVGISIRSKSSIVCKDTLHNVYYDQLGGTETLLRDFLRVFPRYKIISLRTYHSYGFEVIEPTIYKYNDIEGRISELQYFYENICDVKSDELEDETFVEGLPYSYSLRELYGDPERKVIPLPISSLRLIITMREASHLIIKKKKRKSTNRKSKEMKLSERIRNFSTFGNKLLWIKNFIDKIQKSQPIPVGNVEISFADVMQVNTVMTI